MHTDTKKHTMNRQDILTAIPSTWNAGHNICPTGIVSSRNAWERHTVPKVILTVGWTERNCLLVICYAFVNTPRL